jgi:glycosyltransferase involved in cell wall biosynthesis
VTASHTVTPAPAQSGAAGSARPLVTVIIPAYNASAFLSDAVASVLGQTHRDVEVIVVDDGSTDDTAAVLAQWQARDARVRAVHQHNGGLAAARNAGLNVACGQYVAFLDADDVIHPEKLERQVAYLEAHPGTDLVYSDYRTSDAELRPLTDEVIGVKRMPLREAYIYTNVFPIMAPLVRRSLVERVGGFDERLRACEDWDYWVRCERVGTFGYLPGQYATYRMHGLQMHRDLSVMLKYARMAATKNYPGEPHKVRAMVGSVLWWQFVLQKQTHGVDKLEVLLHPRILGTALRMLWEVKSVRVALRVRRLFRHGT